MASGFRVLPRVLKQIGVIGPALAVSSFRDAVQAAQRLLSPRWLAVARVNLNRGFERRARGSAPACCQDGRGNGGGLGDLIER